MEHFPRQGSPEATWGQSGLLQSSGRKGLFTAIPENIVGPGTSTTLVDVPLGPLVEARMTLNLLAIAESLVAGTMRVKVAPIFLNQVPLSSFMLSFLYSLE